MCQVGEKGWLQAIKRVSRRTMKRVGTPMGRSLHVTGAACVGNLCVGAGKLVMGLLTLSVFTCASALYTFGMVAAKGCALAGIVREGDRKSQIQCYKRSGYILVAASVLYMIYSVRLLVHPVTSVYSSYVAIEIAAFTFTELTLNIRGVIIERKNHTLLVHAIKIINLASSLICLVLTQTAILSFTSGRSEVYSAANGLFGILMGAVASILGAAMVIRVRLIEKKEALV